MEDEQPSVF